VKFSQAIDVITHIVRQVQDLNITPVSAIERIDIVIGNITEKEKP